ncbi:MAG: hypothetical protein OXF08_08155 [Bacteroidetes bacterium]|nr:hypothetical protein [Bacteroidota bacterium]
MNRGQVHLLRFIDLGLLLLLAFLSVAELDPTLQVALPGQSQSRVQTEMARISFDQHWIGRINQLDRNETLCPFSGMAALRSCLQHQSDMRFLVAPDENATVQQLVTVLDLCHQSHQLCEIEPAQ